MFEKEGFPEDLSSINISAYTGQKKQNKCQLPCNSIVLFILLGFFFILIGITELISNYQANYIEIPMQKTNNVLWSPQQAYFSFKEEDNVGVYLRIGNLTQFSSNDDEADYHITLQEQKIHSYCHNYRTNQQMGKTIAIDGTSLNPSAEAIPCGYYEGMFLSGTINLTLGSSATVTVNSSNLAYFQYDFLNTNKSKQWVDIESESFKSWIQPNVAITITKLIGHLPANFTGLVQVNITMNNGFPEEPGEVTVILASTKAFANRNVSFCISNFFQSACLFLFASIIFFYNKLIDKEIEEHSLKSRQNELKSHQDSESLKSNHQE